MDLTVITRNAPFMLGGLVLSFQLAIITIVAAMALGIVLASARLSTRPFLYYPATLYIHFFRGLPLILVIFWLYFLTPAIVGTVVDEFMSAVIAFVVFEGAYFAEIIRAGIQGVPAGQAMAADAQFTGHTDGL